MGPMWVLVKKYRFGVYRVGEYEKPYICEAYKRISRCQKGPRKCYDTRNMSILGLTSVSNISVHRREHVLLFRSRMYNICMSETGFLKPVSVVVHWLHSWKKSFTCTLKIDHSRSMNLLMKVVWSIEWVFREKLLYLPTLIIECWNYDLCRLSGIDTQFHRSRCCWFVIFSWF